jgi:hypothetical protein
LTHEYPIYAYASLTDLRQTSRLSCPLAFRSISLHDEIGQMQDIDNYIKSVVYTDAMMQRWNAADKQLVIEVLRRQQVLC